MSKILIIGVGGGGRKSIIKMKEAGIPNADYITFNGFDGKEEAKEHDIPHYNLIEMNGLQNIPCTHNPKVFEELAENVKDQIRAALENSFNKDANGQISKDATASIDGLYLIECLGDNHTFQELYKYKKGERIWKYFEGEYERINGCGSVVSPLNILNIVLETDAEWKQEEIAHAYGGLYIVAYAFQNDVESYYGYQATNEAIGTQLSIQYDKKNYALIYAAQGENFRDWLINLVKSRGLKIKEDEVKWENVRVLSYYLVRDDSEVLKKYFAVQETDNEKKGLFSRIICFIRGIRKGFLSL